MKRILPGPMIPSDLNDTINLERGRTRIASVLHLGHGKLLYGVFGKSHDLTPSTAGKPWHGLSRGPGRKKTAGGSGLRLLIQDCLSNNTQGLKSRAPRIIHQFGARAMRWSLLHPTSQSGCCMKAVLLTWKPRTRQILYPSGKLPRLLHDSGNRSGPEFRYY